MGQKIVFEREKERDIREGLGQEDGEKEFWRLWGKTL